jgi:hypothetical protein
LPDVAIYKTDPMQPLKTIKVIIFLAAFAGSLPAADRGARELERDFSGKVRPFIDTYCIECHSGAKPKAQFDLAVYPTMAAVVRDHRQWELVLEKLRASEMPPEKAKHHPSKQAREAVIHWIETMRREEASKNAGDPGVVLARRLSNAEYDYTIRDLTGVDLRPTREFPVDPANQAGFDNSGESLAMSPALLKKYLQAAREVAGHLFLKPDGFAFAPHLMLVETDRDKYCIQRIVDFYRRQPTDYAAYFQAAWRYQHRRALGKRTATLSDFAAESKISQKYLALIWSTLTEQKEEAGPVVRLQAMWRDLPAPSQTQPDVARVGCEQMRDYVVHLREKLEWKFNNLKLDGFSAGSQPFILWKNRQYASHRTTLNRGALQIEGQPLVSRATADKDLSDEAAGQSSTNKTESARSGPDPDLLIPADASDRAAWVAGFERFCKVFPDAFYVSERGRMNLDRSKTKQDKGRLLSAGFHNMMGYFRDDAPLYELILDEKGRRDLDQLWLEFDFIAAVPERQHVEFIFYERAESKTIRTAEFDFARSEDKDVTSAAKIRRLAEVYLGKARESLRTNGGDAIAIDAMADHFRITDANIRRIEAARAVAEPGHLETLQTFAERAWRRPLSKSEREDLVAFYHSLREQGGLNHEDAIRDSVVGVLLSPYFCYRMAEVGSKKEEVRSKKEEGRSKKEEVRGQRSEVGGKTEPLSDYELASRLSYFLWSSMPDPELLAHAASGDLQRPKILVAQARRMLKDRRARGFAVEFGGNWLDFRRFEEHNAVDRDRFPSFNNELREAMFDEPIRFFLDVVQKDRSVLDFLYANDTFVNPVLAAHYGIPGIVGRSNEWVQVADASGYGRGGLLPMSVFLTKNAPGLRTSPVKRGYWVVRRVLGEQIPPPPAVVPELPHDESKLGDLTLREVLAKHREDASCAACHSRFDAMGLAFEGYGPVGEVRAKDLGGRAVDAHVTFPGGSEGDGLRGLRRYLREHRQDDFLENICRKMLAYGLGRTLMLSDDLTIEQMRAKLAANGYRFGTLVETIVTSPQFLNKRAGEAALVMDDATR